MEYRVEELEDRKEIRNYLMDVMTMIGNMEARICDLEKQSEERKLCLSCAQLGTDQEEIPAPPQQARTLPDPEKLTRSSMQVNFMSRKEAIQVKLATDGPAIGDEAAKFDYVYRRLDTELQKAVSHVLNIARHQGKYDFRDILEALFREFNSVNRYRVLNFFRLNDSSSFVYREWTFIAWFLILVVGRYLLAKSTTSTLSNRVMPTTLFYEQGWDFIAKLMLMFLQRPLLKFLRVKAFDTPYDQGWKVIAAILMAVCARYLLFNYLRVSGFNPPDEQGWKFLAAFLMAVCFRYLLSDSPGPHGFDSSDEPRWKVMTAILMVLWARYLLFNFLRVNGFSPSDIASYFIDFYSMMGYWIFLIVGSSKLYHFRVELDLSDEPIRRWKFIAAISMVLCAGYLRFNR